jgi:hypothetical protein
MFTGAWRCAAQRQQLQLSACSDLGSSGAHRSISVWPHAQRARSAAESLPALMAARSAVLCAAVAVPFATAFARPATARQQQHRPQRPGGTESPAGLKLTALPKP